MPDFRRILCPIDFSEFSIRAYRHALALAWHYHALLFVQHVIELWRHPSADFATSVDSFKEFCGVLHDKREKQLQEFLRENTHDAIEMVRVVDDGIAADSILALAENQGADIIVMGTHGRRGFDRLTLGSVTERVIRKASCPVLVVHRPTPDLIASGRKHDPLHLNRILFCTDFSENSRRALDYATSLATEYDAELTLLHVLEGAPQAAQPEAVAKATAQLERLIPAGGHGPGKIRTRVCAGKPYEQIIGVTLESQTDLVIMAVRGRGALNLAVFGSTAHRVVQLDPCPVLVVHV